MKKTTHTGFHNFEDNDDHIKRWENLGGDIGCAFDYISSSSLLEWLCNEGVVSSGFDTGSRINTYRAYSRMCNWNIVVPQLVLFDTLYLSIGAFYKQHIDLDSLNKLGIIKEFPRPYEKRYYEMYELLIPAVKEYLGSQLEQLSGMPYNDIWTKEGYDARDELKNYVGLAEWLFREFSKDACGMAPNEGELIERLQNGLAFEFIDFMEYACHGQGHFLDAPIPYYSSILKPKKVLTDITIDSQAIHENTFALYQTATSSVLGFQPIINSFNDIIRLREDSHITKIRELLNAYRIAITINDKIIIEEIAKEITAAKNRLKNIQFTESGIYTYGVSALSLVPVVGSIITIMSTGVQLYKDFLKRKNGWIYFGTR